MKERSAHWWDDVVKAIFTQEDWLKNFRLSRETFLYMCNKLRSTIEKRDTVMRKVIPVEQRPALMLWFLATGADYRTIGHLFGVSTSTVCVVVKEVCWSIVDELLPDYIHIRTGAALREVVDGFKNTHGFPQCAGVVDGTHIPIISPYECPADYYNQKGYHSVLCRELLTIKVSSLMFTSDGLLGFMMLRCLPTPACTSGVRTKVCFQTGLSRLLGGLFHSSCWETQLTPSCRGS